MSIPFVLERLTPENFRIVAAGKDPGVRPLASEQGIDKEWDVLISLLTNEAEPPPFVVKALTGPPELIKDDDWFHALRLRDPAMTERLARALQAVDESDLEERFYRLDLSSAYSGPDYPTIDDFEPTRDAFRLLRDFYVAASVAGDAVTFQLRG